MTPLDQVVPLLTDPTAWVALATLIVMEIVLGIDNLIFLSILTNKLPERQRRPARMVGLSLALAMRLVLLAAIAYIVALTAPVFTLAGHGFSWRDMILIAGGLFLVWKATREIHENVDPGDAATSERVVSGFGAAIVQIVILDLVFSIDSIITAVGMTEHLPIMIAAVVVAVGVMAAASGPLAAFIKRNPTIVMLALAFLLMIGMTLIADGFGMHVPRGYIYTAMAFSGLVEALNALSRRAQRRRKRASASASHVEAAALRRVE